MDEQHSCIHCIELATIETIRAQVGIKIHVNSRFEYLNRVKKESVCAVFGVWSLECEWFMEAIKIFSI